MGTFPEGQAGGEKKFAVLVENVCKSYGGSEQVLRHISMSVEQGIVYGLLGSSGCGKTTLLSCIVGLKKWDSGDITVMGNKLESENDVVARNIGYMPQDVALYEELTINEMLRYYGKLYNMSNDKFKEQINLLEELLNLPGYGSRRISKLSGGQKRRVSLALTLLHSPKLLILDEPTVGLDPLLRENIWQYLFNLAKTNKTTIIITTHYIEEVKESHCVGVMRKGTLLVEDDPAALMSAYQTSILEEAVLEICRKDRINRKKSFEADSQANNVTTAGSRRSSKNELQSIKVPTDKDDIKVNKWLNKDNQQVVPHSAKNGCNRAAGPERAESIAARNFDRSLAGSLQRTLAVSKVVWINFVRHPVFILLVLLLPPFQLFTTAVIGIEPKYTPIGIINKEIPDWKTDCYHENENAVALISGNEGNKSTCDLKRISCYLIKQFGQGTYLDLIQYEDTETARTAVSRGTINGYIVIPHNYSSHIVMRALTRIFAEIETVEQSIVEMHMDMSPFVTMYVALTEIYRSFDRFVKEVMTACDFDLRLLEIPFSYREPVYGKIDGTARDYIIPALVGGVLFEIAFGVTPLIFINDIKNGSLERSRVAGLKFIEFMGGVFMTMTTISLLQALVCYIAIEYGLGHELLGSIPAYIVGCLVTAFCGGSFGLVVGILFCDIFMLLLCAIFILPLLMIYSGIVRPFEIIPHPFREIAFYGFPCVGNMRPLRFILNRGASLTHPEVWPGLLVTVGWGVFFAIICCILIRRMKN